MGSIATGCGGPDERAVSPVIAVILMVAIVVILASVLAVFVLGFGITEPGPTVDFEYQYDASKSALLVHHTSGDPFYSDRVTFLWDGNEATWTDVGTLYGSNRAVTIGDGVWIDADPSPWDPANVQPDDTVRIRWVSEDGETSTILDTWEGPDAS